MGQDHWKPVMNFLTDLSPCWSCSVGTVPLRPLCRFIVRELDRSRSHLLEAREEKGSQCSSWAGETRTASMHGADWRATVVGLVRGWLGRVTRKTKRSLWRYHNVATIKSSPVQMMKEQEMNPPSCHQKDTLPPSLFPSFSANWVCECYGLVFFKYSKFFSILCDILLPGKKKNKTNNPEQNIQSN